jgi:hypothetical protein
MHLRFHHPRRSHVIPESVKNRTVKFRHYYTAFKYRVPYICTNYEITSTAILINFFYR